MYPHCHVIRLTSEAAAKGISIKKIDFLHIDGNYSTVTALKDVELYLPKVKKGGYILFSNLFLSIKNEQPRMAAFDRLLDSCEILCDVENHNVALLRKITD